jgi:6-hydroxynicotinate 3-monooxygenase
MGDLAELRAAFEGSHPHVTRVLDACPSVHKWALADRDPMSRWSEGRIMLMGDAAHPMTPTMAQGAAQIQLTSHRNVWMRGRTDGGWLYDYDACTAPLDEAAPDAAE